MATAAHTLRIASLAIAVACSGAATQTYPGPPLPESEVALLRDASDGAVLTIDGEGTWGSSWTLLPGVHEILVHFRIHSTAPNMDWDVWTYCLVALETEKGGAYTTVVRVRKQVISPSISDKLTLEIGIADARGELRGAPRACSPHRTDLAR